MPKVLKVDENGNDLPRER